MSAMTIVEEVITQLPGVLGGGVLVGLATAAQRMYTTRVKERELNAKIGAKERDRSADDSRSIVTEANEERKEALAEVRAQAAQIATLSASIARCEEKHVASDLRAKEKDEKIASLEISLDAMRQLVDRQKRELEAQEIVIEKQGRDLAAQEQVITKQGADMIALHSEMAALKATFDAFVKRGLGVDRISDIPGAGE